MPTAWGLMKNYLRPRLKTQSLCSQQISNTDGDTCSPLKIIDDSGGQSLIDHKYLCRYIDEPLGDANCEHTDESLDENYSSDYDSSMPSPENNFDSGSDLSDPSSSDSSSSSTSRKRRMVGDPITGFPVKDARNAFFPSLVEIMHTPYCDLKKKTKENCGDFQLKDKAMGKIHLSKYLPIIHFL